MHEQHFLPFSFVVFYVLHQIQEIQNDLQINNLFVNERKLELKKKQTGMVIIYTFKMLKNLSVVKPQGGMGGLVPQNPNSWLKLSKKNDIKFVGCIQPLVKLFIILYYSIYLRKLEELGQNPPISFGLFRACATTVLLL